jgi:hypothetical protein
MSALLLAESRLREMEQVAERKAALDAMMSKVHSAAEEKAKSLAER